jgi:hypothetical protein
MFSRIATIALFASVATLINGANYGDGMFLLPFLEMCLIFSAGTYYYPGLGACGEYNVDTDYIVAVATQTFDSYPYVTCLRR